ncbi:MAG: hypothetical protein Q9168_001500 [Polycauliona sp. 1 TL-2023]
MSKWRKERHTQPQDEVAEEPKEEYIPFTECAHHQPFTAYFTMTLDDRPHHMNLETGLPQLIPLIISRSMFGPSTSQYAYLDKLITEAVDSFKVQPLYRSVPRQTMRQCFLPAEMARLTEAYERLGARNVEVKELRVMIAKMVEAVMMVPDAGHCLMYWMFERPSRY